MNFFTHAVAKRGIHQLMTLDRTLARKRGRDDHGSEMLAIAFNFDMRTFKTGSNIIFYEFGCG